MIIAISGSQGSGKSTILKELKAEGFNVVERKTARSILNEWGISLDAVNEDFEMKTLFQLELVKRKYSDEIELALSDELYFTERTFADLFTYSLIAFGQYNEFDKWLDDYYNTCKEYCKNYTHVFYLKSSFSNNIERDGVRSTNQHYSRMIDTIMFDITERMIERDAGITTIDMPDLSDRVNQILSISSEYERF